MAKKFLIVALSALILAGCNMSPAPAREIPVTAKQFSFTPDEIRVKQGERVKLLITSSDVTHGFNITGYNINQQAMPGQTTAVEVLADKAGRFPIICTIFCGTGHSQHIGMLVVEGK